MIASQDLKRLRAMLPPHNPGRQAFESVQETDRQHACLTTKRLTGLFPGLLNPVGPVLPDNNDDAV